MGHPSPHAYALRTSSRDLRPRPPPGLASQPPARASPPPPRVPHPTKVLFTSALHWAQATPMDYYQFRHRANLIAILALIAAIAYAFYVIAGEGVIPYIRLTVSLLCLFGVFIVCFVVLFSLD